MTHTRTVLAGCIHTKKSHPKSNNIILSHYHVKEHQGKVCFVWLQLICTLLYNFGQWLINWGSINLFQAWGIFGHLSSPCQQHVLCFYVVSVFPFRNPMHFDYPLKSSDLWTWNIFYQETQGNINQIVEITRQNKYSKTRKKQLTVASDKISCYCLRQSCPARKAVPSEGRGTNEGQGKLPEGTALIEGTIANITVFKDSLDMVCELSFLKERYWKERFNKIRLIKKSGHFERIINQVAYCASWVCELLFVETRSILWCQMQTYEMHCKKEDYEMTWQGNEAGKWKWNNADWFE